MPELFEKTSIKSLDLRNRLVRSATADGMADENGFPTDSLYKLYERLAKGGIGLIVTGFAFVSQDGKMIRQLGIDREELIPQYRELTDFVHNNGAAIAMQICHCGRQTRQEFIGTQPIAPSPIKDNGFLTKPREMNDQDIQRVIEDFAQASRRVKECGFDAVQLHASHGYLISEFLCPHTNRRKDKWGGSIENRMRFITEIYDRSRKQVGDNYPILVKMNAYDNMKKGLKEEEGIIMAEMMADMGFDGIEASCGITDDGFSTLRGDVQIDVILDEWPMYKSRNALFKWTMRKFGEKIIKPLSFTEAFNLESARKIKSKVNAPVFLVGGMINPKSMKAIIKEGDADYISLSRALITDPNFPKKIKEGSEEPSRCLHCNLCITCLFTEPLRCHYGKRKTPDFEASN